jgi:hypothetical protein
MGEISFNLGDLFEQTFGYKTQAFEPQFATVSGNRALQRNEQGVYGSPYYADDGLGTEYFLPVTITYNGSQTGTGTATLKKWNLPYPVISLTSRKTIVETPLTERRGTVKELINIQDYEIVVKGFIISDSNDFPENDVMTLRTIYEQNVPLSIQCPLTDIFLIRPDRSGSDQIVIRSLKFPAITGVKHIRPYEMVLVSDEPFSLVEIG